MPDLTCRSYKKEILDQDDIPFEDIKQNMKELNLINSLLGGHKITIAGFKKFLSGKNNQTMHVAEIGCGGGDNLNAIYRFARRHKINIRFTGIDINPACIAFAKEQYPGLPAHWIVSDYNLAVFDTKPDIIFSGLFCHHFTNEEIIFMLKWMKGNSGIGFFINDLHRHKLAWYSIKWLTALFSKSYLVKNDAPLSVARGFTKREWKSLLAAAGVNKAQVQWRWAFRHLVMYRNEINNERGEI